MTDAEPAGAGEVPGAAAEVFGPRLGLAEEFAVLLCTVGVERGLIGPREVGAIWDRHVLNCAVVADLLPEGARVVDVGSGAGLPGLALAIRRPDVRVDLVEPLLRRTTFLEEAVSALGLEESVRVVRGRSEEPGVVAEVGDAAWVTARAVAPLSRLVRWCVPLLAQGGSLLAMKGEQAASEIESAGRELRSVGAEVRGIHDVSCGSVGARVVEVVRVGRATAPRRRGGARRPR